MKIVFYIIFSFIANALNAQFVNTTTISLANNILCNRGVSYSLLSKNNSETKFQLSNSNAIYLISRKEKSNFRLGIEYGYIKSKQKEIIVDTNSLYHIISTKFNYIAIPLEFQLSLNNVNSISKSYITIGLDFNYYTQKYNIVEKYLKNSAYTTDIYNVNTKFNNFSIAYKLGYLFEYNINNEIGIFINPCLKFTNVKANNTIENVKFSTFMLGFGFNYHL